MVAPVPVLPRSCVVVELIEAAHVRQTLRSLLDCFHLQKPTTSGFLPPSSVTEQSNECAPLEAFILCLQMFCQPESPKCCVHWSMCCINAPHLLLRDANAGRNCGQGSGCKCHPAQQVYMTFQSRWVATTRVVIETWKTLASALKWLMAAGYQTSMLTCNCLLTSSGCAESQYLCERQTLPVWAGVCLAAHLTQTSFCSALDPTAQHVLCPSI